MELDWQKLFTLDVPLLEIFIRGSCIYLALFFMLRLLKRQTGSIGITDILVLTLIADAAQNGMAGTYQSVTAGVLLVAIIVLWDYALNWLGYRYEWVERILHAQPLPLVLRGRIIRPNLRSQFITEDELKSVLHEQGVEHIKNVKCAYLEGDGKISVIKYDKKQKTK